MKERQAGRRRPAGIANTARRSTAVLLAAMLCLSMTGCFEDSDSDPETSSPPPPPHRHPHLRLQRRQRASVRLSNRALATG